MKSYFKPLLKWFLVYPFVIVLCTELTFRVMGYGVFYNTDYNVKAEPNHAYIGHETFGIRLNPGNYKITLNDKVIFTTAHNLGGVRKTLGAKSLGKPSVVFLGCSFTYGYGVNDNNTFASYIQGMFPDENVLNLGVIGYGTIQSYLQLKKRLATEKPKLAVLNFSSLHFMRNTLSPRYRSNLKIGYKRSSDKVETLMTKARFPYMDHCDAKIKFQPWETMYSNWPLRDWLASVNGMQIIYDQYSYQSDEVKVTACIINKMDSICKENNVRFIVSCLDSNEETKRLKKILSPSIYWHDINFDFSSKELTHLPFDSHPNKKGHKLIADKLYPIINKLLVDLKADKVDNKYLD